MTPTGLSSEAWRFGPDWPGKRCGARGKRTGLPCRNPAMPNGRCRIHGGLSPGAPKGTSNGNYRHGQFTQESVAIKREEMTRVRELTRLARQIGMIED
jgi:hypothetical protein